MSQAWQEPAHAVLQQYPSGAQVVPLTQPLPVMQVCPCLLLQAPVPSHVPAQLSGSSAFVTATQLPAAEQAWQLPGQSLCTQQFPIGIQLPAPQGLNPAAQV
jgi:hypothetical protein